MAITRIAKKRLTITDVLSFFRSELILTEGLTRSRTNASIVLSSLCEKVIYIGIGLILSLSTPEGIAKKNTTKFYYKLDGLSNDWTLTENNSIEFVNLLAGDYTLRIKAKTRHGVVGEENIVKFTIKPPFWKSKIAMCIYIISNRLCN